ncbi:MAG: sugar phosphate nucleotidyltransferase [Candidatus Neomarinimicrobiota bacterium]|nr:sugar phosphate nucleotidyltransferase [Candidatus Neomarinimicrobiota bacterium]|tara:strand:- start:379 stop:1434 length:1056 start_codon:yes stop_codon:yes gene_type:complete
MYCVIMAGGSGTRFWPLSRNNNPKQLLSIIGEKSMLQITIDRLLKLKKVKGIFIITRSDLAKQIKEHVKGVPSDNIIVEPEPKNTAPCIALAALKIAEINENATMAVFPADHLVIGHREFENSINTSISIAQNSEGLVTLGMEPSFPSVAYGYIQHELQSIKGHSNAFKVKAFAEKPHLDLAKRFIKSKDFLWNGGIFIWNVNVFMNSLKNHMPELHESISSIKNCIYSGENYDEIWKNITPESIDYGLMEKSDNIYVVKSKFEWSDLGSWNIIHEISPKNNQGNSIIGDGMIIEGKNNFLQSNGQFIALLGVDNIVVVGTEDAILVVNKEKVEEVKKVVEYLKDNKKELL